MVSGSRCFDGESSLHAVFLPPKISKSIVKKNHHLLRLVLLKVTVKGAFTDGSIRIGRWLSVNPWPLLVTVHESVIAHVPLRTVHKIK
jgi:hypothetical protein